MNQDQQILEALSQARATLDDEPLFALYQRLLQAISLRKAAITLAAEQILHVGAANTLARAGEPHLSFDALGMEAEEFHPWLLQVAGVLASYDPGVLDEVEGLDAGSSLALALRWFEEGDSGAGPTVDALLANALAPYLERAAELLLPRLPLHLWKQAYCPVCAGMPDFALWKEEEGTRLLLCERCRATWHSEDEGSCVFCGEESPESRGFYSSEDDVYRVEVCDTCGHYLKGMSLSALPEGQSRCCRRSGS